MKKLNANFLRHFLTETKIQQLQEAKALPITCENVHLAFSEHVAIGGQVTEYDTDCKFTKFLGFEVGYDGSAITTEEEYADRKGVSHHSITYFDEYQNPIRTVQDGVETFFFNTVNADGQNVHVSVNQSTGEVFVKVYDELDRLVLSRNGHTTWKNTFSYKNNTSFIGKMD